MRSLQPPDILWIHWRVYNFTVNTSKRVLFLPPSDAYVRSFLYLLYTLIKLDYTKALSDQASSLAPDWILLRGPRIPVYSRDSTTFHKWWDIIDFMAFLNSRTLVTEMKLNWLVHPIRLPLLQNQRFKLVVATLLILFNLSSGNPLM